jgi:hypothetical protein
MTARRPVLQERRGWHQRGRPATRTILNLAATDARILRRARREERHLARLGQERTRDAECRDREKTERADHESPHADTSIESTSAGYKKKKNNVKKMGEIVSFQLRAATPILLDP